MLPRLTLLDQLLPESGLSDANILEQEIQWVQNTQLLIWLYVGFLGEEVASVWEHLFFHNLNGVHNRTLVQSGFNFGERLVRLHGTELVNEADGCPLQR